MIEIIFVVAILIMSVVIHEVSHGFVAEILGDPTARLAGRLTLNPIKHLDFFGSFLLPVILLLLRSPVVFGWAKPVPYNPYNLRAGKWGPALVAVAGPLANLLIALVFGLIVRFGSAGGALDPGGPFTQLASLVVLVNVVLMVFNLIPVPPLDGSKILFASLPYRWGGFIQFMERNQLILILILLFFAWQFFLPLVTLIGRLILGADLIF